MRKQLDVSVELLDIAGVMVRKLTPKVLSPHFANHVYLDVHGGAYVFFGGLSSIEEGLLIIYKIFSPNPGPSTASESVSKDFM